MVKQNLRTSKHIDNMYVLCHVNCICIVRRWSIFKEPLNSWTSLFYSLFGIIMFFTGMFDLQNRNSAAPDYPNQYISSNSTLLSISSTEAIDFSKNNLLANYPSFSIVYGISAIYLGAFTMKLMHKRQRNIYP